MITQVWTYDENYIYTGQKIVEEIGENRKKEKKTNEQLIRRHI